MRQRISPATVIALAALFFSMTGAGLAATGYRITSLFQISPKVRHALRGAQGPTGPQGPQGLQGLTGPQGPAGPQTPTIDNFTVAEGNTVEVPAGGAAYSIAACPSRAGHYVWAAVGSYTGGIGLDVFYDADLGLEWQVGASNPTSSAIKLTAWVLCLTGTTYPTTPG